MPCVTVWQLVAAFGNSVSTIIALTVLDLWHILEETIHQWELQFRGPTVAVH